MLYLSEFCQKNKLNKFICNLFKLSGILFILIIIMLIFVNYFVLINKQPTNKQPTNKQPTNKQPTPTSYNDV